MIFNTVVNDIRSEIGDSTTNTKTRVERWVNDAHKKLCGLRPWPFLIIEESDTMSVAVAAVPYPVASITFDTGVAHESSWAVDEILDIWDVTDSIEKMEKTTLDRLRQQYQTILTETGTPEFWFYARQVRADSAGEQRYINFYPGLAETRSFRFRFTRKPTTHAAGSVLKLLIPDEWQHVLYELILWKCWRQRGDDRWVDAQKSYEEGLEDMKKKLAGQMVTGFNPAGVTMRTRFPQTVTA
jgi:hypothetical protein